MYCKYCGTAFRENARFCSKCGQPAPLPKQEVVYLEEKPMESILSNGVVIGLTFFVLIFSIVTIICTSIITKDIPAKNQLAGVVENVVLR